MSTLRHPTERDWRNVFHWIARFAPLIEGEQQFIKIKKDLITLRTRRESDGLGSLMSQVLRPLDQFMAWCGWRNNVVKLSIPL